MSVLHILAIILGILTVATRLPGVLWPKGFREHSLQLIESDLVTRAFAVFAIAAGLVIFVAIVKTRPWLEVILLLLAVIWLPSGALILWNPDLYRRIANKVLLTNDLTLRSLCVLGVLIGFLLCFLGIFG